MIYGPNYFCSQILSLFQQKRRRNGIFFLVQIWLLVLLFVGKNLPNLWSQKIGKNEKKNLMLNLASFNCKENTTTRKEKRVGSGLVSWLVSCLSFLMAIKYSLMIGKYSLMMSTNTNRLFGYAKFCTSRRLVSPLPKSLVCRISSATFLWFSWRD